MSNSLLYCLELINEEWPFYNNLHSLWSELPSYNPIGIITSCAGQDLAAHAASLWNLDCVNPSGVSSRVEDSTFPEEDFKTGDEKSDERLDSNSDLAKERKPKPKAGDSIDTMKKVCNVKVEIDFTTLIVQQKSITVVNVKSVLKNKDKDFNKKGKTKKHTVSNAFEDLHKLEL